MEQWDYPDPFVGSVVVDNADIDGLGHANNAAYVTWCETVAWQHSESLGLTVADYQETGKGMAISSASYEYHAACFESDELLLATWLTSNDRRLRMERRFQFRRKIDEVCVFRGCWQLICLNLRTGAPSRIPVLFNEVYGPAIITIEA